MRKGNSGRAVLAAGMMVALVAVAGPAAAQRQSAQDRR